MLHLHEMINEEDLNKHVIETQGVESKIDVLYISPNNILERFAPLQ